MKEFRKTKENLFICEECEKTFKLLNILSYHIRKCHNGQKEYYDKWLKEKDEGICKWCKKETRFQSFGRHGYTSFCSRKCLSKLGASHTNQKLKDEKRKKTCIEKYNVINVFQLKEIQHTSKQTKKEKYGNGNYHNIRKERATKKEKYSDEKYNNKQQIKETQNNKSLNEKILIEEKRKQTLLINYGVEYLAQSKEIREKGKQTRIEKYGDENYTNKEKAKQTNLKNLGVEYPTQSEKVKEKGKQTCLKKYGVEYNMQNKEIHEKQQKSGMQLKQYKNTNIHYRGTFELDFLDKHYNLFPDMINAKSIKYLFEEKQHVYHPDFYIPSLNLIVEIKSSYYYKKYKEICDAKAKAVTTNNYKYVLIIDKDYSEFDKYLAKAVRILSHQSSFLIKKQASQSIGSSKTTVQKPSDIIAQCPLSS